MDSQISGEGIIWMAVPSEQWATTQSGAHIWTSTISYRRITLKVRHGPGEVGPEEDDEDGHRDGQKEAFLVRKGWEN